MKAGNKRYSRYGRFFTCAVIFTVILVSAAAVPVSGSIAKKVYESRINLKSVSTSVKKDNKGLKRNDNGSLAEEHRDIGNSGTDINDRYLILVNKKNNIGKDFIPDNLKVPKVKFLYNSGKQFKKMESDAAGALEDMFHAAGEQGINLLAVSGYRAYSYQEWLYNRKVEKAGREEADKYVAPPGGSEHQTGLAMDIVSDEFMSLNEGFCKTRAYKWFEDNAHKYGFIIRYPKGKEDITTYSFEPWHLRYVGREAACKMKEKGLVLEEYIESLKE